MRHQSTPQRLRAVRAQLAEQDATLAQVRELLEQHSVDASDLDPRWLIEADEALESARTVRAPVLIGALARC